MLGRPCLLQMGQRNGLHDGLESHWSVLLVITCLPDSFALVVSYLDNRDANQRLFNISCY